MVWDRRQIVPKMRAGTLKGKEFAARLGGFFYLQECQLKCFEKRRLLSLAIYITPFRSMFQRTRVDKRVFWPQYFRKIEYVC